LLRREDELNNVISWYKNVENRRKKEAEQVEKAYSWLTIHYSSRRYKLAGTLSEGAPRVPGMQKVVRSELTKTLVPMRSSSTPGSSMAPHRCHHGLESRVHADDGRVVLISEIGLLHV